MKRYRLSYTGTADAMPNVMLRHGYDCESRDYQFLGETRTAVSLFFECEEDATQAYKLLRESGKVIGSMELWEETLLIKD